MKQAKRPTLAREALLTLALAISSSFISVAATPVASAAVMERRAETNACDLPPAEKAKLRRSIKTAMAQLKLLSAGLEESCRLIMTESLPYVAIEKEPFTVIATYFRGVEEAMKDKWAEFSGMPIISDEVNALRKALAVTRSRAVQNAMLIKQMTRSAEFIESDTDISGLGALASLSTERLLKLVS